MIDFEYEIYNNRCTVTKYIGNDIVINMPSEIDKKTVSGIGWNAFSGCSDIVSVTISDNVSFIGYYAFENCTSLKSITIPKSVSIIGSDAFIGCQSLERIIFKGRTKLDDIELYQDNDGDWKGGCNAEIIFEP